ncbi:MAG: sulfite reductase subunit C [Firmicutes bacterium]|nr:sulfite reductase subunit C [Bacillota bacterium]MBQ1887046.1 sulfite reductase subunit C [Bacillota bacterium]MBQ2456007.1 sulfite reductase subunit C [Bacillota bacterium]MBQ5437085.1 sulfite reductase subunit C [Bacillota bacterium]
MNRDINIKATRINCFRQSKVDGIFMLQMRVPGGMVDAKYLEMIQYMAKTWGDGNFHFGTRQTFDIPGIKYDDIPAVNAYIENYIKEVDAEMCDVDMNKIAGEPAEWDPSSGYPTIGARNITACIGNYHCICGNINTFELARKLEKIIFPSHYHIKINIAGCPNDCNKAHLCDFGIIGTYKFDYHPERCIGCGLCAKKCEHGATRVLSLDEGTAKILKDPCCCVGCGECARACPTSAWQRHPEPLYRVILGGRTGRQTPRLGKMFLNWASEDVIIAVLKNWQKFSAWVMDYKPEYLHGGHLIDRAGYKKFKEIMLEGVELNPECMVAEDIFWNETEYRSNFNVKPIEMHHHAGPQD